VHEKAARFWVERGEHERAELDERGAQLERELAQLERDWAALHERS
jgi:hypothetical protein